MSAALAKPEPIPVGGIKQFGPYGPEYEVVGPADPVEFEWRQRTVCVTTNDDMGNLFLAISVLEALPWFPASVRDIRAFRVEQWSNITRIVKS